MTSETRTQPSAGNSPYLAILLSPCSRTHLTDWWDTVVSLPLLPDIHSDHVTLVYNPLREYPQFCPGKSGAIHVIGWAADANCQAVWVESDPISTNDYPHITVSTMEGLSGYYSHQLLKSGINLVEGPYLEGIVRYITE